MSLKITPVKYSPRAFVRAIPAIVAIIVVVLFLILTVNRWFNPPDSPPPPQPLPRPSPASDRTSESVNDQIISFILAQEGGFNPNDPSFEGVFQPTYDHFREVKQESLKALLHDAPKNVHDLQDRMDIVYQFYHWYLYELRSGVTVVPGWFRLMLADYWVTSMSASIKPLQAWAGVEVDGVWGTHTEKAVIVKFNALDDKPKFARWYTQQRKAFYRRHGYGESHPLLGRADIVLAETLKKLHGTDVSVDRTIKEVDVRVHTPLESLSLAERIERIEDLLEKR